MFVKNEILDSILLISKDLNSLKLSSFLFSSHRNMLVKEASMYNFQQIKNLIKYGGKKLTNNR